MPVKVPGFDGGDRTSIAFPKVQSELISALHNAGKKVILVNFSGSALSLEKEKGTCDAILQVWYPGEEGGTAITDILYGKVSPSGKLPITFYKDDKDLPAFEDYSMKGRTYRFFNGQACFPFGYGLTYSSFKFSRPKVRKGHVMVKVKNTGNRDATQVLQVYMRRPSDKSGPKMTLRAFQRVDVPAGKTVLVKIPLTREMFSWWDEKAGNMAPLPGRWEILTGPSSDPSELRLTRCNLKKGLLSKTKR